MKSRTEMFYLAFASTGLLGKKGKITKSLKQGENIKYITFLIELEL